MIKNILSGISVYAGAFRLLSKLKLWNYFVIPIVISLLTATIIGVIAYSLSDTLGQFLSKIWIWDWGKETFTAITSFLGGVFILVIGLIFYKHIVLALSAPFMSTVSEKIEIHINGNLKQHRRKTTFQEQLWRGIRINIRNLGKELLITIPILLLKFIPLVNIFSTVLLFLVQAYYAGFGNMDYTLERHLNYKNSLKFVGKNKGFSIGNGIIFMGCLFIPILGIIIVLPLSVTAASIKTVELLNNENERSIL
jgi:CysZ protein